MNADEVSLNPPAKIQKSLARWNAAEFLPSEKMKLGHRSRFHRLNILQVETANQIISRPAMFRDQIDFEITELFCSIDRPIVMIHRLTIFNWNRTISVRSFRSQRCLTRPSQSDNDAWSLFPNHLPKCICGIRHWALGGDIFAFWTRIRLMKGIEKRVRGRRGRETIY